MRHTLFAFVLVIFMAGFAPRAVTADTPPVLQSDTLTVVTQGGEAHVFNIEIADTPFARQMGLMFRTEMAEDHGMLFWFDGTAQPMKFWMKNTLIPLDMLFLDPTGKIVYIVESAEPETLTPRGPDVGNIAAVIELNGGIAAKQGITVGDQVQHKYFD